MKRLADDDRGNLMLLAGIVITIAFVTTALTLSEVASLERKASAEATTSLAAEWRFLRDRLSTNFRTAVTPDMSESSFNDTTMPAVANTFRAVESEKGFDLSVRRATTLGVFNKTEASLLSPPLTGPSYDAYTIDGLHITWAKDSDPSDGILWKTPCDDTTAPAIGCISGLVLSVQLSDGVSTLSEVLVLRTNTG